MFTLKWNWGLAANSLEHLAKLAKLATAVTRDWHFGFETSRFRNFCQIFEGFGFGKFGFGKKSLGFGFKKNWSRKKVSVSVSEYLVSEKRFRFRFQKNLVSEKSLGLGFGKFGLGKEKIQITRTVLAMMSQIWDLVPIGAKALKWSHISPNSACPKFHPCGKMPS